MFCFQKMAIFVRSVRTTTLHATTDTLTLQFGIIAICCSLCGSACRSSGQTEEEGKRTVDVQAAEPVPSDFEMVFGEGGGFVGQWSGHTIRADGSVFAWSGPVAGANMDSLGVLGSGHAEPDLGACRRNRVLHFDDGRIGQHHGLRPNTRERARRPRLMDSRRRIDRASAE